MLSIHVYKYYLYTHIHIKTLTLHLLTCVYNVFMFVKNHGKILYYCVKMKNEGSGIKIP